MSSSHTEVNPAAPGREAEEAGGTLVSISMPQMGISVSEGTIVEWHKSVGDEVNADETICEVTTDKVDVEIPCPATGVLTRIIAEPGQTLPVGELLAEISTGSEARTDAEKVSHGGTNPPRISEPESSIAPDGAVVPQGVTEAPRRGERAGFVSPVVRRIADEHGVDLSTVEGHGIGGRIRKRDLLAHIESGGNGTAQRNGSTEPRPQRALHIESPYVPDPAPAEASPNVDTIGEGMREPMSTMRRSIGEHMVRSLQTSAHCTTVFEVDFSAVARRRRELKDGFARKGVPLTYLAFVARAVTEALEEFPALNSSVDGDAMVHHADVNLGIAVSLDADETREGGLIVPVIKRAQRLSLEGMAAAIAELATKARERKLDPDDVQGGTFTITNPGQFGAVMATPIINQPQVAILDLEAIVKRPVVVEGADGTDAIAIRPMGFLPMSWDHRAIDGAEAARFLASVKAKLEGGAVR